MEQMDLGNLEIGTKELERTKLEPKKVKIVGWNIVKVEKAHAEKVEFEVKHPDREENIYLSSVSYLDGKQVTTSGTWLNKDDEGKLQKGSVLTIFLNKIQAINLNETKDKEIETEQDEKGYLVFKCY